MTNNTNSNDPIPANKQKEYLQQKRREQSVKLLVADITSPLNAASAAVNNANANVVDDVRSASTNSTTLTKMQVEEQTKHAESIMASTVAAALERNLDREFYSALNTHAKEGSATISKICNAHSDDFLGSVSRLVSLGCTIQISSKTKGGLSTQMTSKLIPASEGGIDTTKTKSKQPTTAATIGSSAELKHRIEAAGDELGSVIGTGGAMLQSASSLVAKQEAHRKARATLLLVQKCHRISVLLEKGKRFAAVSRPRAALDAVDEAKALLQEPLSYNPSLLTIIKKDQQRLQQQHTDREDDEVVNEIISNALSLQNTPFGRRISLLLPKIELEVLTSAKRGLTKWFLEVRSNGSNLGCAVMRSVGEDMASGGEYGTGIGGSLTSYLSRVRLTQDLLARADGRVAKTARKFQKLPIDKNSNRATMSNAASAALVSKKMEHGYIEQLEKVVKDLDLLQDELIEELLKNITTTTTTDGRSDAADVENFDDEDFDDDGVSSKTKLFARQKQLLSALYEFTLQDPSLHSIVSDILTLYQLRPGLVRRAEVFPLAFEYYECWDYLTLMANKNIATGKTLTKRGNLVTVTQADQNIGVLDSLETNLVNLLHPNRLNSLLTNNIDISTSMTMTNSSGSTTSNAGASSSSSSPFFGIKESLQKVLINGQAVNVRQTDFVAQLLPSLYTPTLSASVTDHKLVLHLTEAISPVIRAKKTYSLLGKVIDFTNFYEQNRFGESRITQHGNKYRTTVESRSSLSSLTGDDVSVGTDRFFHAKKIPHLCSSVVGFSAVEAALELSHLDADETKVDEGLTENALKKREIKSVRQTQQDADKNATKLAVASSQYERSLLVELGFLLRSRANTASSVELARASYYFANLRSSLRTVFPLSSTRRFDKELLGLDVDVLIAASKVASDELGSSTRRAAEEDRLNPLVLQINPKEKDKEVLPFGLYDLVREDTSALPSRLDIPTSIKGASNVTFNFSSSIPIILRSIHSQVIIYTYFILAQCEFGQRFSQSKGACGHVMDCLVDMVSASCGVLRDSLVEQGADTVDVEHAIQMTANISAILHSLPRLFGCTMQALCQLNLVHPTSVDEAFSYADDALKRAENSCDQEVGQMYSLVYEISRNKIDMLMNMSLENINWVAKTVSADAASQPYCETLIEYMKTTFASLAPLDEGSRAGIHFSCCGHVAERLVRLLSERADSNTYSDGIPPIIKIDAYGIKRLSLDCRAFEEFARSLKVPQLSECFSELECLTSALLDRDLPMLLQPRNENDRRRRYPFLSLEKVANILEKYVGTGLGSKFLGGLGTTEEMLIMERKDVLNLLKIVRDQL